jgi:hypothetical protein
MELKPCPHCGSEDIATGAFSICDDCYVCCDDCGAMIETSVPWDNMTEQEHDTKCLEVLTKLWNTRVVKCDSCYYDIKEEIKELIITAKLHHDLGAAFELNRALKIIEKNFIV